MPTTTPILFPSGEDANPLNRRLPAEVITRKRREVKRVEEKPPEEVQVDLKSAIVLKPEQRIKWLARACKMAEEGKASTTELYGIISSRKFVSGLHAKIGRKMRDIVRENIELFSEKQQRHLDSKEWVVFVLIGDRAVEPDAELAAEDRGDPQEEKRVFREASPRPAAPGESRGDVGGDSKPRDSSASGAAASAAASASAARETSASRPASSSAPAPPVPADSKRAPAPAKPAGATTPKPPEPAEEVGGWRVHEDHDRARREAHRLEEERNRRRKTERQERDRLFAFEEQAELEHKRAKTKKIEAQVDSSMMLLDRLLGGREEQKSDGRHHRDVRDSRRSRSRRRRDRSRSVSIKSASRSPRRGKKGKRSRSRSLKPMNKKDFQEALKRRLAEREERDTTRIPVVDPGHAARWA